MDETEKPSAGGKKYQVPDNMEQRKLLLGILRNLDTVGFKKFVKDHLPDLVSLGWDEKDDLSVLRLLHEFRASMIALNDDFVVSRNFLRAEQFGYTPEEADQKPTCAQCRWFQESPSSNEEPCIRLGSIPTDVSCKAFKAALEH